MWKEWHHSDRESLDNIYLLLLSGSLWWIISQRERQRQRKEEGGRFREELEEEDQQRCRGRQKEGHQEPRSFSRYQRHCRETPRPGKCSVARRTWVIQHKRHFFVYYLYIAHYCFGYIPVSILNLKLQMSKPLVQKPAISNKRWLFSSLLLAFLPATHRQQSDYTAFAVSLKPHKRADSQFKCKNRTYTWIETIPTKIPCRTVQPKIRTIYNGSIQVF